ncbi:MAG: WD40 repeat domain-containing protein [Candidatus Poribacteria bacterium]|nr:WD40 repeat domain-containing protein [Candidatus Poribacteria bacterium]
MIRDAISNFQILPIQIKNIMQAIARINPATPSLSKPLIRLAFSIASAILIALMFGIDSQNSLRAQSEVIDDQDDFTKWALPENATARFGKGRIIQMQYSPDDTQLAVATPIGIWIYDAQSGEELNLLTGHRSEVYSVAYSSDGSTIAAGAWDGVKLWDAVTGDLKSTIKANAVRSMTFSPDGSTIVTGSNHGPVHFWDVATGLSKAEFTGHTSIVSAIAYSPDRSTIATASEDDTVRLWDVSTGQTEATLTGHTEWVTSVDYSPDGMTIATTSLDDTVRLWDAISGNHINTLTGHKHYAMSVEYSPDGNTIASRGWDGIIFWHVDVENDEAIFRGIFPKFLL